MLIISCMRSGSTSLLHCISKNYNLIPINSGCMLDKKNKPWKKKKITPVEYIDYPSSTGTLVEEELLIRFVEDKEHLVREHLLPVKEHLEILVKIPKEKRKAVILKRDFNDSVNSEIKRKRLSGLEKKKIYNVFKIYRENLEIFKEEYGFLHIEFEDLINNNEETIKKILNYFGLKEKRIIFPHYK